MTEYRQPNSRGITFPEGLPSMVESALLTRNAALAISSSEAGKALDSHALVENIKHQTQDAADELMFDWLNGHTTPKEVKKSQNSLTHPGDRKNWLGKVGLLSQYNRYMIGAYFDLPGEEMLEKLQTTDEYPLVLVTDSSDEDAATDDGTVLVVHSEPYYGFKISREVHSNLTSRRANAIEPTVGADAGISFASIDAELSDRYSELDAECGKVKQIDASEFNDTQVLTPEHGAYDACSLSQALALALALPKTCRIKYDASQSTTKTDALITRATDLVLNPIYPTNEGWGGSNIYSSVVVLRAVHSLFGKGWKHDTNERRDFGKFPTFVAEELARSRFFPNGSRDKKTNFEQLADLAVTLSKPMELKPMSVLEALYKVAPR